MTDLERAALYSGGCVVCGHRLIDHHESHLRCQHYTKAHWWSRRKQCPCTMEVR